MVTVKSILEDLSFKLKLFRWSDMIFMMLPHCNFYILLQKDPLTNIVLRSFGKVFLKKGANARIPYEHQKNAMENLDIINKSNQYSTMIVLSTGGGKTYTASMWLLKNALDHKKKILWIAHRQMLPEDVAGQMADSAARNKLIVSTYQSKQKEYGQTIVFAINVIHAIHLNVNILTEGVDLPQTQTVFLAIMLPNFCITLVRCLYYAGNINPAVILDLSIAPCYSNGEFVVAER